MRRLIHAALAALSLAAAAFCAVGGGAAAIGPGVFAAIACAMLIAWRLGILDREAAWLSRAPALMALNVRAGAAGLAGGLETARAALFGGASPVMIRMRRHLPDDTAAVAFVRQCAADPRVLAVDLDGQTVLFQALNAHVVESGAVRAAEAVLGAALARAKP
jgi:hypothetical protein